MTRINPLYFIYGIWLALGVCLLALSGCMASKPHVAHSEGGTLVRHVDGTLELRQGNNAKSVTSLDERRDDGTRLKATLGTSRAPVITVPPAPDWTPTIVVVAGVLCLIGGGVLAYKGWPKMGTRAGIIGAGLVVIGLTVGAYAWAYALALIACGGYLLWEMYSAYRKGENAS